MATTKASNAPSQGASGSANAPATVGLASRPEPDNITVAETDPMEPEGKLLKKNTATVTDGQLHTLDPHKGEGGTYFIDDKGVRRPVGYVEEDEAAED